MVRTARSLIARFRFMRVRTNDQLFQKKRMHVSIDGREVRPMDLIGDFRDRP